MDFEGKIFEFQELEPPNKARQANKTICFKWSGDLYQRRAIYTSVECDCIQMHYSNALKGAATPPPPHIDRVRIARIVFVRNRRLILQFCMSLEAVGIRCI